MFTMFVVHVLRKLDAFHLHEDWQISEWSPVISLNKLYASELGLGWWTNKPMSVRSIFLWESGHALDYKGGINFLN